MKSNSRAIKTALQFGLFGLIISAIYLVSFFIHPPNNPFAPITFFFWVPFFLIGFILGAIEDAFPPKSPNQTSVVVKVILALILGWLVYVLVHELGIF